MTRATVNVSCVLDGPDPSGTPYSAQFSPEAFALTNPSLPSSPLPDHDRPDADPPASQVVRLQGDEHRLGLNLLLTGAWRESSIQLQHFLSHARKHHWSLDQLYVIKHAGVAQAAALVMPYPGRTGLLFLSPLHTKRTTKAAAVLLRQVVANLDPEQVVLVQALLEPDAMKQEQALLDADFEPLATLHYMQSPGEAGPTTLKLPPGVELEARTYEPELLPTFQQAIQDSYLDTRDCPGLVGRRSIDDVIQGHMNCGEFDPANWLVLTDPEGQGAGVLLLAKVPANGTMELVYLGLAPAWRGRSIAKALMRYALAMTAKAQASHLTLAVDQTNTPAVRLYENMGFRTTARKVALIRSVSGRQAGPVK